MAETLKEVSTDQYFLEDSLMFLQLDETRVSPSGLQLFDHIVAGANLLPHGEWNQDEFVPDASLFVQVTLGTALYPGAIPLFTRSFPLVAIPDAKIVYKRWRWLKDTFGNEYSEPYLNALLKYVWHIHQLRIEFQRCEEGMMRTFVVHLGNFQIAGRLPRNFTPTHYFGESSRLVDTA